MVRPKGFYITERLNKRINKAVEYLRDQHGINGVDRSTVLVAMLDDDQLWNTESLDRLVDRVMNHLTRRLTRR